MQQLHRPETTARIIPIRREFPPMKQDENRKAHPGYKAHEAFAGVAESLCTTEAFFLSRLGTLTQPELEKAREEVRKLLNIAREIHSKISCEIADRYQE